jgi:release factor glutamine methyltransferase
LPSSTDPESTARQTLVAAVAELVVAGNTNPRRDAELLLLSATGWRRNDLITDPERPLTAAQLIQFRQLIGRRKAHEPIQYITGEREFYGLRFEVNPSVLIPRPETEHLVEAALERISKDRPTRIADIGTGSGAIAVAIAHHRALAEITALDISPAALEVAIRNAIANEVDNRIRFFNSDLLSAVAGERFDMIVSNPPYIAYSEHDSLEPQVRDYEPQEALFAGPTGFEVYEKIIPQAQKSLRPAGWLLMEIGAGQHVQLQQLLISWNDVGFVADLQGIARVAIARAF